MKPTTPKILVLLVSVSLLPTACGPKAELVSTRSRRVDEKGRLDAVLVESMYSTQGMHGRQMLYEVDLLNSRRQPVQAAMRSYRNREGHVAAGKTVMAEEVTGTPNHVAVRIPVAYLSLTPGDLPAYARVRLTEIGGDAQTEEIVQLPVAAADIAGPSDAVAGGAYVASSDASDESFDEPAERRGREERYAAAGAREGARPPRRARENDDSGTGDRGARRSTRRANRGGGQAASAEYEGSAWAASESARTPRAPRDAQWRDDGEPGAVEPRREMEREVRGAPQADSMARLEASVRANPNDVQTQLRLRLEYLSANREADALATIPGTSQDNQE